MNKLDYIGDELELFSNAQNWKNYWSDQIISYLGKRVLEVGAGLGGTTKLLLPKVDQINSWSTLEPDPKLAEKIMPNLEGEVKHKDKVKVEIDVLDNLAFDQPFDSLLYIDVIEHIENDKKEVQTAIDSLAIGGHLIILVPAHNFLFSPFDKAIGHYRRYNKKMLAELLPDNAEIVLHKYLDSVGLILSLANKLLLKQSYPTLKQILFWDNYVIPISRILDKILFFNIGKSVLLVCQRKK